MRADDAAGCARIVSGAAEATSPRPKTSCRRRFTRSPGDSSFTGPFFDDRVSRPVCRGSECGCACGSLGRRWPPNAEEPAARAQRRARSQVYPGRRATLLRPEEPWTQAIAATRAVRSLNRRWLIALRRPAGAGCRGGARACSLRCQDLLDLWLLLDRGDLLLAATVGRCSRSRSNTRLSKRTEPTLVR